LLVAEPAHGLAAHRPLELGSEHAELGGGGRLFGRGEGLDRHFAVLGDDGGAGFGQHPRGVAAGLGRRLLE
jgi:hypothetical protein